MSKQFISPQKFLKFLVGFIFSIPVFIICFSFSYYIFNENVKQFYDLTDYQSGAK